MGGKESKTKGAYFPSKEENKRKQRKFGGSVNNVNTDSEASIGQQQQRRNTYDASFVNAKDSKNDVDTRNEVNKTKLDTGQDELPVVVFDRGSNIIMKSKQGSTESELLGKSDHSNPNSSSDGSLENNITNQNVETTDIKSENVLQSKLLNTDDTKENSDDSEEESLDISNKVIDRKIKGKTKDSESYSDKSVHSTSEGLKLVQVKIERTNSYDEHNNAGNIPSLSNRKECVIGKIEKSSTIERTNSEKNEDNLNNKRSSFLQKLKSRKKKKKSDKHANLPMTATQPYGRSISVPAMHVTSTGNLPLQPDQADGETSSLNISPHGSAIDLDVTPSSAQTTPRGSLLSFSASSKRRFSRSSLKQEEGIYVEPEMNIGEPVLVKSTRDLSNIIGRHVPLDGLSPRDEFGSFYDDDQDKGSEIKITINMNSDNEVDGDNSSIGSQDGDNVVISENNALENIADSMQSEEKIHIPLEEEESYHIYIDETVDNTHSNNNKIDQHEENLHIGNMLSGSDEDCASSAVKENSNSDEADERDGDATEDDDDLLDEENLYYFDYANNQDKQHNQYDEQVPIRDKENELVPVEYKECEQVPVEDNQLLLYKEAIEKIDLADDDQLSSSDTQYDVDSICDDQNEENNNDIEKHNEKQYESNIHNLVEVSNEIDNVNRQSHAGNNVIHRPNSTEVIASESMSVKQGRSYSVESEEEALDQDQDEIITSEESSNKKEISSDGILLETGNTYTGSGMVLTAKRGVVEINPRYFKDTEDEYVKVDITTSDITLDLPRTESIPDTNVPEKLNTKIQEKNKNEELGISKTEPEDNHQTNKKYDLHSVAYPLSSKSGEELSNTAKYITHQIDSPASVNLMSNESDEYMKGEYISKVNEKPSDEIKVSNSYSQYQHTYPVVVAYNNNQTLAATDLEATHTLGSSLSNTLSSGYFKHRETDSDILLTLKMVPINMRSLIGEDERVEVTEMDKEGCTVNEIDNIDKVTENQPLVFHEAEIKSISNGKSDPSKQVPTDAFNHTIRKHNPIINETEYYFEGSGKINGEKYEYEYESVPKKIPHINIDVVDVEPQMIKSVNEDNFSEGEEISELPVKEMRSNSLPGPSSSMHNYSLYNSVSYDDINLQIIETNTSRTSSEANFSAIPWPSIESFAGSEGSVFSPSQERMNELRVVPPDGFSNQRGNHLLKMNNERLTERNSGSGNSDIIETEHIDKVTEYCNKFQAISSYEDEYENLSEEEDANTETIIKVANISNPCATEEIIEGVVQRSISEESFDANAKVQDENLAEDYIQKWVLHNASFHGNDENSDSEIDLEIEKDVAPNFSRMISGVSNFADDESSISQSSQSLESVVRMNTISINDHDMSPSDLNTGKITTSAEEVIYAPASISSTSTFQDYKYITRKDGRVSFLDMIASPEKGALTQETVLTNENFQENINKPFSQNHLSVSMPQLSEFPNSEDIRGSGNKLTPVQLKNAEDILKYSLIKNEDISKRNTSSNQNQAAFSRSLSGTLQSWFSRGSARIQKSFKTRSLKLPLRKGKSENHATPNVIQERVITQNRSSFVRNAAEHNVQAVFVGDVTQINQSETQMQYGNMQLGNLKRAVSNIEVFRAGMSSDYESDVENSSGNEERQRKVSVIQRTAEGKFVMKTQFIPTEEKQTEQHEDVSNSTLDTATDSDVDTQDNDTTHSIGNNKRMKKFAVIEKTPDGRLVFDPTSPTGSFMIKKKRVPPPRPSSLPIRRKVRLDVNNKQTSELAGKTKSQNIKVDIERDKSVEGSSNSTDEVGKQAASNRLVNIETKDITNEISIPNVNIKKQVESACKENSVPNSDSTKKTPKTKVNSPSHPPPVAPRRRKFMKQKSLLFTSDDDVIDKKYGTAPIKAVEIEEVVRFQLGSYRSEYSIESISESVNMKSKDEDSPHQGPITNDREPKEIKNGEKDNYNSEMQVKVVDLSNQVGFKQKEVQLHPGGNITSSEDTENDDVFSEKEVTHAYDEVYIPAEKIRKKSQDQETVKKRKSNKDDDWLSSIRIPVLKRPRNRIPLRVKRKYPDLFEIPDDLESDSDTLSDYTDMEGYHPAGLFEHVAKMSRYIETPMPTSATATASSISQQHQTALTAISATNTTQRSPVVLPVRIRSNVFSKSFSPATIQQDQQQEQQAPVQEPVIQSQNAAVLGLGTGDRADTALPVKVRALYANHEDTVEIVEHADVNRKESVANGGSDSNKENTDTTLETSSVRKHKKDKKKKRHRERRSEKHDGDDSANEQSHRHRRSKHKKHHRHRSRSGERKSREEEKQQEGRRSRSASSETRRQIKLSLEKDIVSENETKPRSSSSPKPHHHSSSSKSRHHHQHRSSSHRRRHRSKDRSKKRSRSHSAHRRSSTRQHTKFTRQYSDRSFVSDSTGMSGRNMRAVGKERSSISSSAVNRPKSRELLHILQNQQVEVQHNQEIRMAAKMLVNEAYISPQYRHSTEYSKVNDMLDNAYPLAQRNNQQNSSSSRHSKKSSSSKRNKQQQQQLSDRSEQQSYNSARDSTTLPPMSPTPGSQTGSDRITRRPNGRRDRYESSGSPRPGSALDILLTKGSLVNNYPNVRRSYPESRGSSRVMAPLAPLSSRYTDRGPLTYQAWSSPQGVTGVEKDVLLKAIRDEMKALSSPGPVKTH